MTRGALLLLVFVLSPSCAQVARLDCTDVNFEVAIDKMMLTDTTVTLAVYGGPIDRGEIQQFTGDGTDNIWLPIGYELNNNDSILGILEPTTVYIPAFGGYHRVIGLSTATTLNPEAVSPLTQMSEMAYGASRFEILDEKFKELVESCVQDGLIERGVFVAHDLAIVKMKITYAEFENKPMRLHNIGLKHGSHLTYNKCIKLRVITAIHETMNVRESPLILRIE